MSNEQNAETQPESAQPTIDPDDISSDSFFEALVDEIVPPEQPPAQETSEQPQAQKEEESQAEQAGATDPESSTEQRPLSPLLAETSRREREARAEIEALKQSKEEAVEQAKLELLEELVTNPQGALQKYEKLKAAAGDLALNFYAAELGEDAPDDLKQQVGMSDVDRKLAALEARIEQERLLREQAAIQARNQAVLDQYNGFLNSVPENLPYLASEVAADPNAALSAMAEVADSMYQKRGSYPAASEVAQLIEDQISSIAARYAAIQKPSNVEKAPQTDQVETKSQPSKTLSTDHSGSSAKPVPVGEDEIFEDAMAWMQENFKPLR
jgi:hypothetical protein